METATVFTKVDTLKAEIDSFRPLKPEQERQILKKFRLDWNYHSNALEGNTVTLGETQIFLEYGLTAKGKPFKDYLDIRGHDEAITFLTEFINRKQPLTEAAIRELHKILLCEPYVIDAISPSGVPTKKTIQIGQYKTTPNHVLTPTGAIHNYATPEETPAMMGDLMKWYFENKSSPALHPVELAARFHHRFVAIHPFDDGNGRMSRLLMNLMLLEAGFPPVVIKNERKDEYLFALRTADQGNITQFVDFVAEELIRSEELYLRGAKGEPVEELDDVDKEIRLLKQELQHIGEPVKLSPSVQAEIFDQAIIPFLNRLADKLSKFDDLFAETLITLDGTRTAGGAFWQLTGGGQVVKGMLEAVERTRKWKTETLIHQISLDIRWNAFKKLPLSNFSHNTQITFAFEQLRYSIKSHNFSVEYFVYGQILAPEVIAKLVNQVCEGLLKSIRKEADAYQAKH